MDRGGAVWSIGVCMCRGGVEWVQVQSVAFLRQLSENIATEFYRQAKVLSPESIKSLAAKQSLVLTTAKTDLYEEGGQALPVDVWRGQGWKIDESKIRDEDTQSGGVRRKHDQLFITP